MREISRSGRGLAVLVSCVFVAGAVLAGTTRDTTPHMPQGGAAARTNGDFVSAATGVGGLDTFYRYYIEVPAGSTKIQVDLWDADVGAGPATEDDAGRDRPRGGGFNTTATYTLIDPNGTTRTPRFTTGTAAGVNDLWGATTDNTWLTFYSATGNDVADNFGTAAYSNNNGNNNWSGDWIETDNDDVGTDPAAGTILITGGELRIGAVVDSTPAPQIQREADLLGTPGLNMGMAYLTFSFRTSGTLEDSDQISVQVSGNGGGSWTNLETFFNDSSGTRSYDITPFIANDTRIRFLWVSGFGVNNEFFFFDNVQISDGSVVAGHWELRVDESAGGDDINALGVRAHDGDPTGSGTEMNVYMHSMMELGVNPNGTSAATRNYTHFPWIVRGCTCGQNDFDVDSAGSTSFTSQAQCISGSCTAGTFTQSFAAGTMSGDNVWNRDDVVSFTTDSSTVNYGIWTKTDSISTYFNPAINGNYETVYVSNSEAAANDPTSNPFANTFRIYLPADSSTAGTAVAPAKPYLEQELTHNLNVTGPNPPQVGQTTTFTVTVRLVNPTPHDITFSTPSNVITANVPGGVVLYGGNDGVSQGSVTSEPAINGSGDVVWNPGTVAGGTVTNPNVVILHYDIRVTPADSSPIIVTGLGSSTASGTRAQYIDETGNTTQAAALNLLGPLCELRVQANVATDVFISSFEVDAQGGRTLVEWTTASEAGTIGFNLHRQDGDQLTKVNDTLLPASYGSPQGGRYVFADATNASASPQYVIEEVTASGKRNRYGPFISGAMAAGAVGSRKQARIEWNGGRFERTPRGGAAMRRSVENVRTDIHGAVSSEAKRVDAVMVGVRETGVVSVPAGELAALFGKPLSQIQKSIEKGDIAVTSRGSTVAWTAPAGGSTVLFFGEKSDSMYATERVYRIEMTRGVTMKNVSVAPASGPVSTYTAVADAEVDSFPASALPLDPDQDYWFWDFVISGDADFGRRTFSLDVTSLASSAAGLLDVRLQGAIAGNTHSTKVSMNGVPLGQVSWSDLKAKNARFTVPASVLREGANEVVIEGTSSPSDIFYIDGFTLRYPRLATAVNGMLEMAGSSGATTAGGFSAAPLVLDITSRLRPSLLQGAPFASGNVSFVNPASAKTLFFASGFVTPSSVRASTESPFRSRIVPRAEYVVITPAALRKEAAELADLRQRDGLSTFLADLDEIYDHYSGGNPTPFAIGEFITDTMKWNKVPRYFVLVGAGTDDYRGIFTSPGLMPPFMVKTADGIFASDSRYADRNKDGLPEVAVGRIPVSSGAELRDYIRKLSNNRTSTTRPIVFSADANDGSVDFRKDSGLAEVPLASRPATRIYLDETGGSGGRTALLNAWQSGTPLVNWVGHGGLDQLSNSSVLTAADAASLESSSDTLPVVVAMTCTINRFEIGFVEALGAALTRVPDAGALAVWSASGLSVHNNAAELQRTFMRLAAATPNARIGDLMVKALAMTDNIGETGSIYLLLGDPAIKLTLPAEPAATPPTTRE